MTRMSCRIVAAGVKGFLLSLGLLLSFPAEATAHGFSLQLHSDIPAGTAIAEVADAVGARIASFTWQGQLPSSFDANRQAYFVPVVVLGNLRDQVAGNRTASGGEAHQWIQAQMGAYATTPLSGVPAQIFALVDIEYFWEWCGQGTNRDGRCPENCVAPNTWTCAGCGCRGTKGVR